MLRAALYARVSTEEQAAEGASIIAQRRLLAEYAARHQMQVVAEFVDEGASARSADRPAFQRMVAAARQRPRPFDLILVHKTDRFARNREDSVVYKSLLRRDCGVEVMAIAEPFEDSPTGKLLEGIMEVMAEFYSLNLSQEVKKGMGELAGRGRALGRPPFGYAIAADGRLAVVAEEAAIVRWIFTTYVAGETGLQAIARRLAGEGPVRFGPAASRLRWSAAEVRNILCNPAYTGDLVWNRRDTSRQRRFRSQQEWIVASGAHPAIIDRTTFDAAGAALTARRCSPAPATDYALRGLVRCLDCGGPMGHLRMQWQRAGGERCVQSQLSCTQYHRSRLCYFNHVPVAQVESALAACLRELLGSRGGTLEVSYPALEESQRERAALQRQLQLVDLKQLRQLEAFEAGAIGLAELKAARGRIDAERAGVHSRLAALEQHLAAGPDAAADPEQRVAAAVAAAENCTLPPAQRRRAIASVVHGLWYSRRNDHLKIALKV